jgi:WD40 repeat protein
VCVRERDGMDGTARAVSGSNDATVRVWDISKGRCHAICYGHTGPVVDARWLGHRRVVSASIDGTAKLWQAASADCIATFTGLQSPVCCMELAPRYGQAAGGGGGGKGGGGGGGGGGTLLLGGKDGTVSLWGVPQAAPSKPTA